MSIVIKKDHFAQAQIVDLVVRERAIALSHREWTHRLAGYGYGIRETDAGVMVETLPHRIEVCMLPADLAA